VNVLIVGSGKGSWMMRGQQLGAAIGARVTSQPTDDYWRWAELAVLVKKAGASFAPDAHRFGVPVVWDALDCWRQPDDNRWTESYAKSRFQAQIDAIRPMLVIGATQAMAEACEGVFVPHHSWQGLTPTPAREQVRTVAYQGNAAYLGTWAGALQKACTKRGWTFAVNPSDLSTADILVAFRDGPWDGWICREWKSGVKIVNAIAAGRPLISQNSAAVRELQPDGSIVERPSELAAALDFWSDRDARQAVVARARDVAERFTLSTIARDYLAILTQQRATCSA